MKRLGTQSGQALLAATFGLVVLLGAAGLAVDMGYLRYQRRLQQSAADSAALAGAAENPSGNAVTAALQDSSLNGFTDGVNNVTVNVNTAYPFGATTGVQVQVSAVQPTFFMRIFGLNNSTVSAAAVATYTSARNCLYALAGGAGITNSGTLTANGCGIVDDQNLQNTGSITAASVSVHGAAFGSVTIPAAITGIIEAGDPLFRLTPPAAGGCSAVNVPAGGGTYTLNPGTYCGIKDVVNRNVTFNAGTYLVTGNGINLNGQGTITGTDVTLYVAAAGGAITINNLPGSNQTLSLAAPTTGAYAGILFYQDPANALAATIDGKSASKLEGTFYFPGATLNLSDTGNLAAYTIAVARTLVFTGTVNLAGNYTSLAGGSPIKNAVLVE